VGSYLQGTKTLRIKFTLRSEIPGTTVYAQVWRKRGTTKTAVGTARSADSTDTTYSEDISGWQANDIIYIELLNVAGSGTTAYLTDFILLGKFEEIKNEIIPTKVSV